MKIYRFVPNAKDYRSISKSAAARSWPDGIDLGPIAASVFPKSFVSDSEQWGHEGNRYRAFPEDLPLSDFPALSLNIPVVSVRAARVLAERFELGKLIPITVDGHDFLAIQMRSDPGAFLENQSDGVRLPDNSVLYYYRRCFDISKVQTEFFSLPCYGPFSDLYVTETMVSTIREFQFTGLEYLELVFDEAGPVVPRYPRRAYERCPYIVPSGRIELETELMSCRGLVAQWIAGDTVFRDALDRAIAEGLIPYQFTIPSYER